MIKSSKDQSSLNSIAIPLSLNIPHDSFPQVTNSRTYISKTKNLSFRHQLLVAGRKTESVPKRVEIKSNSFSKNSSILPIQQVESKTYHGSNDSSILPNENFNSRTINANMMNKKYPNKLNKPTQIIHQKPQWKEFSPTTSKLYGSNLNPQQQNYSYQNNYIPKIQSSYQSNEVGSIPRPIQVQPISVKKQKWLIDVGHWCCIIKCLPREEDEQQIVRVQQYPE